MKRFCWRNDFAGFELGFFQKEQTHRFLKIINQVLKNKSMADLKSIFQKEQTRCFFEETQIWNPFSRRKFWRTQVHSSETQKSQRSISCMNSFSDSSSCVCVCASNLSYGFINRNETHKDIFWAWTRSTYKYDFVFFLLDLPWMIWLSMFFEFWVLFFKKPKFCSRNHFRFA